MYSSFDFVLFILGFLIIDVLAAQAAAVITSIACGIRTTVKYKSSFFLGTALIVLGIRFIFSISGSVPVTILISRSVGAETTGLLVVSGIINSVSSTLLDIAVIVLFCMHYISRYKTGTVNMIVGIAAKILSVLTGIASNRALADYLTKKTPAALFLSVRFLSILLMAAAFISVIRLFLTAKAKEPERRILFVFPLILMINGVFGNIINSVSIAFSSLSSSDLSQTILIFLPLVSAVAILTGSVYILKTAGKTAADNAAPDGKINENI